METLEVCLGHITKNCPGFRGEGPDCIPDKKNKDCPYYQPIILRTFEVTDYAEQTRS